jgi:hypothetical protein
VGAISVRCYDGSKTYREYGEWPVGRIELMTRRASLSPTRAPPVPDDHGICCDRETIRAYRNPKHTNWSAIYPSSLCPQPTAYIALSLRAIRCQWTMHCKMKRSFILRLPISTALQHAAFLYNLPTGPDQSAQYPSPTVPLLTITSLPHMHLAPFSLTIPPRSVVLSVTPLTGTQRTPMRLERHRPHPTLYHPVSNIVHSRQCLDRA